MNTVKISGAGTLTLIFLALFVPTTYIKIKMFFLGLSLLSSLYLLARKTYRLNQTTLCALGLVSLFGVMNSVHGLINNTPGAIRVLTVTSLWPLLYAFLAINLNNNHAFQALNKTLWLALTCIVFYSFLYLGYQAGFIPGFLYFELNQGQTIGFYDGFIEYNLYSLSSLLFLVPFAIHQGYLRLKRESLTLLMTLIITSSLVLVFLTGRRAVFLILLISPLLIVSTNLLLGINKKNRRTTKKITKLKNLTLIVITCLLVYHLLTKMDIRWDSVWSTFIDGFDFKQGSSTYERALQFHSLINAWMDGNVLFGAGNGAATDVVRSHEFPWAYELTYIYLLFSNGIIGVLFYFSWFVWGLWRLRKAIKFNPETFYYIAPITTGVFGLVIGAASNPYFGKFDYLWIIMLPHLLSGGVQHQRFTEKYHDSYNYSKLECRSSTA